MEEIWKDIKGYEELYQVSNLGRIKSMNYNHTGNSKILKGSKHKQGYVRVSLWKNKKSKSFFVHTLVAKSFIKSSYEGLEINHKNGIKHDNNVDNLEIVTHQENVKHSYK